MSYNPFSLQGKTILITGASSGIGKATAIECSKMGAQLIITGRNEVRLQQTFDQLIGMDHELIVCDLTKKEDIIKIVESTPALDGIVHSAGISGHFLFKFLKEDQSRDMMEINFFSPLWLTQSLFKSKKINNGASIVFISSIAGVIVSFIGGSVYSASKGALNGLTKNLAIELAPKKIRVNSIVAGMIDTPIIDDSDVTKEQIDVDKERYPLKRYGTPEEVASAAIFLLSDGSSWTTGSNLIIDGGRSASF